MFIPSSYTLEKGYSFHLAVLSALLDGFGFFAMARAFCLSYGVDKGYDEV
jgi:hypothetical protein